MWTDFFKEAIDKFDSDTQNFNEMIKKIDTDFE